MIMNPKPDRQESFDIISALSEKPRKRPQRDVGVNNNNNQIRKYDDDVLKYAPPKKLFSDPRKNLPPIKASAQGPGSASRSASARKRTGAASEGAIERFQKPMKDREAYRSALVKAIM